MKIVPTSAPETAPNGQPSDFAKAQATREKAIAAFMGSKAPTQEQPTPAPAEVLTAQATANVAEPTQTASTQGQDYESDPTPTPPKADPKAIQSQEEQPLSSQYAQLARREKAFRAKVAQEQAVIKAEREKLEQERATWKSKEEQYQTQYVSKERLSSDTIDALREAGIDYDKVTEMVLSQQQTPTDPRVMQYIKQLESKVNELKAETQSAKKSFEDGQRQNYDQAVVQIGKDAAKLVRENPTEFEAINATGSSGDIKDLIVRTFEEDGEMLSVEEAAKLVEEELVERLSKFATLSKIQRKTQASSKPAPQLNKTGATPTQDKQLHPAKTLTNNLGGAPKLTARERAILAFQGKLNK